MSFLAYDTDRLVRLHRGMVAAAEELRSIRCDDPAAADALRAIRITLDALEVAWLPVVVSTLRSDVLAEGGRDSRAVQLLENSLGWVMSHGYGWAVAPDPLGNDGVNTGEEARALAVRMGRVDAETAADDPAVLSWLIDQLGTIAADPRLSRDFLANFDGWAEWGDALARSRAALLAGYPGHRVDAALIDGVFEALGHVQRAAGTASLPWLDDVTPYTAAAIVRHLDLDAEQLATVTDHLLRRAAAGHGEPIPAMEGPDVGDLLYPVLLLDPEACHRFVVLAAAHPATMFAATADPALAFRVAVAGTAPSQISTAEAGRVVPGIIRYFAGGDAPVDGSVFLADLITPWTFQLAPAATDWELGRDERARLLDFVVNDVAALNRLIDNSDAVIAGAVRSLGTDRAHRLSEFSSYVGMMGVITVNQRVKGIARRRRAWNLLCGVASIGASLIPGVVVGVTATVAVMAIQANAGPDLEKARKNSLYSKDLAVTIAAAVVMHTLAGQLKCEGVLPADFPPTPQANPHPPKPGDLPTGQFWDDFEAWMNQLPGGWDGPVATRVLATVYSVWNPYIMGADVGEQVSGNIGP